MVLLVHHLLLIALIFLFNGIVLGLSDEEALIVLVLTMDVHMVMLFLGHELHLLVVWRSEHFLVLSLSGQLRWKDLALNVSIWSDV